MVKLGTLNVGLVTGSCDCAARPWVQVSHPATCKASPEPSEDSAQR